MHHVNKVKNLKGKNLGK
ncbi:MAG: hypothetical protein ACLUGJ_11690 [Blautia wexlerae]